MHVNHYARTLDEFIRRVEQGEPQDGRDISIAREALTELRRCLDREPAAPDRDIVTSDARTILNAIQPVEWWSTRHPNVVVVSLDGDTAIWVDTAPAVMPEHSPYETDNNRYPEHLEAEADERVTYERALQVVSDFTEGLSGDNPEYERGQLELLADLFGGPEPDTQTRIERIRADIRALAVGLWVVGDQETGERLGVFPSHDKAASFIGGLPGHQDGHYYLDGPCRDLILRDPSAED